MFPGRLPVSPAVDALMPFRFRQYFELFNVCIGLKLVTRLSLVLEVFTYPVIQGANPNLLQEFTPLTETEVREAI